MWRAVIPFCAGAFSIIPAEAQQLPSVTAGRVVRIVTTEGRAYAGRLLTAWPQETEVRLCRGAGAECRFERDPRIVRIAVPRIAQVQVPHGSQWRRGLIIGGVAGLAVGGALALLAGGMECDDCDRPTTWPLVPIGVVTFGLIGTGAGAATPRWAPWPGVPQD